MAPSGMVPGMHGNGALLLENTVAGSSGLQRPVLYGGRQQRPAVYYWIGLWLGNYGPESFATSHFLSLILHHNSGRKRVFHSIFEKLFITRPYSGQNTFLSGGVLYLAWNR